MSKITNWSESKKVNRQFKEVKYTHDKSSVFLSIVFDGAAWYVWYADQFAEEGGEEMGKFPTKEKAIDFAIRYMKSHPEG
jgi:hypothetical protein